jgi:hypothetical protein
MTAPLDPVIAQIIPLLPLRDPETMTPQSARDSLRALAAARADIPPPQVQGIDEIEVTGARVTLAARAYRVSREKSPTVVFSTAAAGSPATSKRMTGRPVCSPSKQVPSLSPSTIGVRRKRDFPARSRML